MRVSWDGLDPPLEGSGREVAPLSSLTPVGVTARCTADRPTSAPTASAATTIDAPICPARPWTEPEMIGSPSVSTPTSGAMVAVAMTLTVEVLMPPKISGSASGSSTERTTCGAGHAHAARGVDGVAARPADADVGVGEDRRDREQGERDGDVPELRRGREERDEERDQRHARHGAADVGDRDGRRTRRGRCGRATSPSGSAIAIAIAIASDRHLEVRPQQRPELAAADLRAARLRLARVEDEVDGVAEVAEEGQRASCAAARVQGVSAFCSAEDQQVEHDREQRPPGRPPRARSSGSCMSANSASPSPPAPARKASEAEPDRRRDGDPQPGHDLGQRERQLDPPQQLARRQPHPAAGVARLGGHVRRGRR